MYRRNRTAEFLEGLKCAALTFVTVIAMFFLLTL